MLSEDINIVAMYSHFVYIILLVVKASTTPHLMSFLMLYIMCHVNVSKLNPNYIDAYPLPIVT